jgi:SNF2 family DNA or RNA helicase
VHRDLDLIAARSPDLVILDEAQRIKNWSTRTARSVKKIASPYAIVLTGTPLENRLEELMSIVQFVDQHRLGPTFRFLHDHQVLDDFGKIVGYRNLDDIGTTLAPVLIRRRKEEVLRQLPERLEKRFFVPMTPQQMQYHEIGVERVRAHFARRFRSRSKLNTRQPRSRAVAATSASTKSTLRSR